MSRRRLGFFGGTFDPIHWGHLSLAISLCEAWALDEVLISPARQSPGKTAPVASIENRIEMTRLAILGVPRLKLDLWESRQEKPSFTIDTLRYLKESSDAELFLLLSDETALSFQQWREPEAILALASPLVGSRHNAPSHHCPHLLREGWTRTPLLEISSTQIRERLKAGLYCGHLVPDKVLDYITKNPVYFRP